MQQFRVGEGNVVPSRNATYQYELYDDRVSVYNHYYGRSIRDVKYVMFSQLVSLFALPLRVVKVQGKLSNTFYYGIQFPTVEQVTEESDKHPDDSCPASICVSSLPRFIMYLNGKHADVQFDQIVDKQHSMLTTDILRLFCKKQNNVQGDMIKPFVVGLSNKEHIAFLNTYHKFAGSFDNELDAKMYFIERWKQNVMLNPLLDIEAVADGSMLDNQYTYTDAISTMNARIVSPDYKSEPFPSCMINRMLVKSNMPRDVVPVIEYVQKYSRRDPNAFFLYDGRFNVVIVPGYTTCPYSNATVAYALQLYMVKILDTLRIAGFNKSMNASKFVPLIFPTPSIFVNERIKIDQPLGFGVPPEYYVIFNMYLDYLATGHVNEYIVKTSPHHGEKLADNQAIYQQAQLFHTVVMRGLKCDRALELVSVSNHLLSDCIIPEHIMAYFNITSSNYMSIGYPDHQPPHADPKHRAPIIIDPPVFSRLLFVDTELDGKYSLIHDETVRTFHGYMKNANAIINFILKFNIHKQPQPHILYLGGSNGKSLILVRLLFPNIEFTVVDPIPMNYQHEMRLRYLAAMFHITLQPLTYVKEYFQFEHLSKYKRRTYIYSDVFINVAEIISGALDSENDERRLKNTLATTAFHHDILREAIRINKLRTAADDKLDKFNFLAFGVKLICPYSDGTITIGHDVYIHGYQKFFSGHEGRYYVNLKLPTAGQMHNVSCTKLANALVVASLINKRSFFNTVFKRNAFHILSSPYHQFCPCYNCVEWLLNCQSAFIESGMLCSMDTFLHQFFYVMNMHMLNESTIDPDIQ